MEKFIDDHHKLLTAIGVFAGLTALFLNIQNEAAANMLSFWSFAVFGILSWELLKKFPPMTSFSNMLVLFQVLVICLGFTVFLYLLTVYWAYSLVFGGLFSLLFSGAIIAMYANFSVKHKKAGKAIGFVANGAFYLLTGFVVMIILFLIIYAVCYVFGIPLPWTTA